MEELQEALTLELTDSNFDSILEFREMVAAGLQNPSHEDKRKWFEILQVNVTVTNGLAVTSCRFGNNPGSCNLFEINNH